MFPNRRAFKVVREDEGRSGDSHSESQEIRYGSEKRRIDEPISVNVFGCVCLSDITRFSYPKSRRIYIYLSSVARSSIPPDV